MQAYGCVCACVCVCVRVHYWWGSRTEMIRLRMRGSQNIFFCIFPHIHSTNSHQVLCAKNCCEINTLIKELAFISNFYTVLRLAIQIYLIKIPHRNLIVSIQIMYLLSQFIYFNCWTLMLIVDKFKFYFNKENDIFKKLNTKNSST